MKFNNPYWTLLEKMQTLQGWIITQSMLYYKYQMSLVTDSQYDANCMQLVHLMKEHPRVAAQSKYLFVFDGFDGSTGFDLESRLNDEQERRFEMITYLLRRQFE